MITATMSDLFTDSKLMNKATVTVQVDVTPSKLMDSLAAETLGELRRLAPYAGFTDVSELEPGDILKYLSTVTWMRTCLVNRDSSKTFLPYRNLCRRVAVPVLAYQMLVCIGVAYDRDYAIEFRPAYQIGEESLLAPDQLMALSDVMIRMENCGLKVTHGLPVNEEGELDFMALCHVEETVLGYRKSHPVYGFLASFFRQKELNEVTGMMCRVIYGYDTDYKTYVSTVFSHMSKAPMPETVS